MTNSSSARPRRVFAAALLVLTLGSVSYVRAVPLIDSTDDLNVIIRRIGVACPDETDVGEKPDHDKPRDSTFAGRPCVVFKRELAKKMSEMSRREPLTQYLERNEF